MGSSGLDCGAKVDGSHQLALRIYYEDTDAGGVVYYANYLRFAERARTEMLRLAGVPHEQLREQTGATFAVSRCQVEYLRPAKLDDEIWVSTRLTGLCGASAEMEQIIGRGDARLAHMAIRLAFVSSDGKPTRLPPSLRNALTPLLDSSESPEPAPRGV